MTCAANWDSNSLGWASAQSDQSLLSTQRNIEPLAILRAHSQDSDQTGQMPRPISIFAGYTGFFVGFVMQWLLQFIHGKELCFSAIIKPKINGYLCSTELDNYLTNKNFMLKTNFEQVFCFSKGDNQISKTMNSGWLKLLLTQGKPFTKTVQLTSGILENTWAPSSKFVSSSIPSRQILTAHAQPFRGARDLAFCLKVPLESLLVWASSKGSGETVRMRRLAWTFAARIGDKYQIRLTRCT